jgi:hypothetical protein
MTLFEEAAQILRDMTKHWMQLDMILWTLAAEWQAGNLTSYTAETAEMFLAPDEWPGPVAAYLTGSITAEELEKAAAAATPRERGPTPGLLSGPLFR